jgi:hypothetical protein
MRVSIPKLSLLPGRYSLTAFVTANGAISDWIKNATTFDVESGDYFGTGQLPSDGEGVVVVQHAFDYKPSLRSVADSHSIEEHAAVSL